MVVVALLVLDRPVEGGIHQRILEQGEIGTDETFVLAPDGGEATGRQGRHDGGDALGCLGGARQGLLLGLAAAFDDAALEALLLGLGPTGAGAPGAPSFSFLEKLFTCMSAFGTVGLDVGVTAHLNRWGQMVLMVGMFVGRLGIMLLLSALYGSRPQPRVGYPRAEIVL
jgi:hypothetical protein